MKVKRPQWAVQSNTKYCVILKMCIIVLSTVFALHLLYSNSIDGFNHHTLLVPQDKTTTIDEFNHHTLLVPHEKTTTIDETQNPTIVEPTDSAMGTHVAATFDSSLETPILGEETNHYGKYSAEECDFSVGEWIRNPEGPAYTNETCKFIEDQQNCMMNGRPDLEYMNWRWSPRNCELPLFDAIRFLDMMRNKVWGLVGDSISRNHVQSLLCLLSKVEEPAYIYHDEGHKSRGYRFPSFNLTVYVFWSPFLVEATIYEDSDREIDIHLDKVDKKWTQLIKNLDYVILSTGKWFLRTAIYYENNKTIGCHYCRKKFNLTEHGFDFAYRKALRNMFDFIVNLDHKGVIFFRTVTSSHFEGGDWSSGGRCDRTVPFKEGEIEMSDLLQILRRIELEEYENATKKVSKNGVELKLLDVMQLSLLRADGHPGLYRNFYPLPNKNKDARPIIDCLHWCLPGPIDSWNDVLMQMLLNH